MLEYQNDPEEDLSDLEDQINDQPDVHDLPYVEPDPDQMDEDIRESHGRLNFLLEKKHKKVRATHVPSFPHMKKTIQTFTTLCVIHLIRSRYKKQIVRMPKIYRLRAKPCMTFALMMDYWLTHFGIKHQHTLYLGHINTYIHRLGKLVDNGTKKFYTYEDFPLTYKFVCHIPPDKLQYHMQYRRTVLRGQTTRKIDLLRFYQQTYKYIPENRQIILNSLYLHIEFREIDPRTSYLYDIIAEKNPISAYKLVIYYYRHVTHQNQYIDITDYRPRKVTETPLRLNRLLKHHRDNFEKERHRLIHESGIYSSTLKPYNANYIILYEIYRGAKNKDPWRKRNALRFTLNALHHHHDYYHKYTEHRYQLMQRLWRLRGYRHSPLPHDVF